MAYEPCRYARRWPDVWAGLPNDEARRQMSDGLASSRLAGELPTRESVEKMAELYRGDSTTAAFVAELTAAAKRGETPGWLPGVAEPDPATVARPVRSDAPVDNTAAGTRQMIDEARKRLSDPPR